MTYADGRVSADVEVILGDHWFQDLTMFFVQDGEYWKLDEEIETWRRSRRATPPSSAWRSARPTNEYALVPNATSNPQSPVLIFHATNGGQELHELLVVQLPEGADPMGLLDGSLAVRPDRVHRRRLRHRARRGAGPGAGQSAGRGSTP